MKNDKLLGLDAPGVWDTEKAYSHLHGLGLAATRRTAQRRLAELLAPPLTLEQLQDAQGRRPVQRVLESELAQARVKRKLVLLAQLRKLPGGQDCLQANDTRGARYWVALGHGAVGAGVVADALDRLREHIGKDLAFFPHGRLVDLCRKLVPHPSLQLLAYPSGLDLPRQSSAGGVQQRVVSQHLARLEAESIHILREAVAEAENPVMLYSVGKDSSVMLHLARKAFFPSPPPFPLLHVDTRWKFRQMYEFRDQIARRCGMELLVHTNPEAIAKDINPFDHGSALHTDITKTDGLKQALDQHRFDMVFGGARRDEEKSRAKERVFSFRTATHQWDPKNQRPELWNLYNTRKSARESIRVFPLSNWTELDVWQYIRQESIPVVPLYFAEVRPVVQRDGLLLMVDDDRFRLLPGEQIEARKVRFRTLGCYPLTGAVESDAQTVSDILLELVHASHSERQGRAIDADASGSMEKKKVQGYF